MAEHRTDGHSSQVRSDGYCSVLVNAGEEGKNHTAERSGFSPTAALTDCKPFLARGFYLKVCLLKGKQQHPCILVTLAAGTAAKLTAIRFQGRMVADSLFGFSIKSIIVFLIHFPFFHFPFLICINPFHRKRSPFSFHEWEPSCHIRDILPNR